MTTTPTLKKKRPDTYCLICKDVEEANKELILYHAGESGLVGCEETENQLKLFFTQKEEAQITLLHLKKNQLNSVFQIDAIPYEDWNKTWRESVKPVKVSPSIWIGPEWAPPTLQPNELWLKIEPQMAFGTGHHPSTQLPCQALELIQPQLQNKRFMDVGAGSGILCFAANLLGAKSTLGVEGDDDCFDNLILNTQLNNPKPPPQFILGLTDCLKEKPIVDVLSINMIRTLSMPLIASCYHWLSEQGICIWSGILVEEREKIMTYLQNKPWDLIHEFQGGEWWCGVLKKR